MRVYLSETICGMNIEVATIGESYSHNQSRSLNGAVELKTPRNASYSTFFHEAG